jgi:hypothetical protein
VLRVEIHAVEGADAAVALDEARTLDRPQPPDTERRGARPRVPLTYERAQPKRHESFTLFFLITAMTKTMCHS